MKTKLHFSTKRDVISNVFTTGWLIIRLTLVFSLLISKNANAQNFEVPTGPFLDSLHDVHPTTIRLKSSQGTINVTHYKQCGQTWSANTMGSCSSTICSVGCAMTCTSILLKANGVSVDPGQLNTWMTNNYYYSNGCDMGWDKIPYYPGASLTWIGTYVGTSSQYLAKMKEEINAGNPVIVKVDHRFGGSGTCAHFVVVYGYSGTGTSMADFVVSDPGTVNCSGCSLSNFTFCTGSNPGLRLYHNVTGTGGGDPCANVITIGGSGSSYAKTYTGGPGGSWFTSSPNPCGYSCPGKEQVYKYTVPTSGTYSLTVSSTSGGWVDFLWKSNSCGSTGWTCIQDIASPGAYGSMNWSAGQVIYLLADDEDNSTGSTTFYINAPGGGSGDPCANIITIGGSGSSYAKTYTGGPGGSWFTSSPNPCGYSCPGKEQVYKYTVPTSGTYSLTVSSTSGGWVDFLWKSNSCGSTGWTCIQDIASPGTYGSMTWSAGQVIYLLADDEDNSTGSTTFYINAPGGGGCPTPSNMYASSVTATSATINFTATNAISYDYYLKTSYAGSYNIYSGYTYNPVMFNGLLPNTSYNFKVKSYCSSGSSNISAVYTFSTLSSKSGSTGTDIQISDVQMVENKVNEIDNLNHLILFPNPVEAGQTITIEGVISEGQFSLYSLEGKQIVSKHIEINNAFLVIPQGIPSSVYLVKFVSDTGNIQLMKLIVK